MEKTKKEEVVRDLKESFDRATSCIAFNYEGTSMEVFTPLRKDCARSGLKLSVVKNSLAKIAASETTYKDMDQLFEGMTALVFTYDNDQVAGAKMIKKYAKDADTIKFKGGIAADSFMDAEQVEVFSQLPSKEELQAKLLRTMLTVPENFVRLLSAVPRNFLYLLNAYKDKKEE